MDRQSKSQLQMKEDTAIEIKALEKEVAAIGMTWGQLREFDRTEMKRDSSSGCPKCSRYGAIGTNSSKVSHNILLNVPQTITFV